MNVKIGELVEYVEGLNNASRRRANRMHGTINDLLAIKKELEEQADGDAQLIKTLELQLKVTDERVISCEKSFKEMEAQIDKSIKDALEHQRKLTHDRLKQFYGFSDTGLKDVGVL